jgi:hypothetical protein
MVKFPLLLTLRNYKARTVPLAQIPIKTAAYNLMCPEIGDWTEF